MLFLRCFKGWQGNQGRGAIAATLLFGGLSATAVAQVPPALSSAEPTEPRLMQSSEGRVNPPSPSNNTLNVQPVLDSPVFVEMPEATSPTLAQTQLRFTDVSPDHWAYEALLFLSTGSRRAE